LTDKSDRFSCNDTACAYAVACRPMTCPSHPSAAIVLASLLHSPRRPLPQPSQPTSAGCHYCAQQRLMSRSTPSCHVCRWRPGYSLGRGQTQILDLANDLHVWMKLSSSLPSLAIAGPLPLQYNHDELASPIICLFICGWGGRRGLEPKPAITVAAAGTRVRVS
jgi:hypothetical protein